jgi:hypothetical protein
MTHERDEICENCGLPSQEHWALNYSNGAHVSTTVLVCPTGCISIAAYTAKRS